MAESLQPLTCVMLSSVWLQPAFCACRDGAMGLTLDPQLIRDLTVLITSSTVGGMVMEALRQPVINGYFIAGSVVGPGGLKLVKVWPRQAFVSHQATCSVHGGRHAR